MLGNDIPFDFYRGSSVTVKRTQSRLTKLLDEAVPAKPKLRFDTLKHPERGLVKYTELCECCAAPGLSSLLVICTVQWQDLLHTSL